MTSTDTSLYSIQPLVDRLTELAAYKGENEDRLKQLATWVVGIANTFDDKADAAMKALYGPLTEVMTKQLRGTLQELKLWREPS